MKALSIKQPWADLIVLGMKDIENRKWRTNYRGRLLIHASQQIDEKGEWLLCSTPIFRNDMNRLYYIEGHAVHRGFIIGAVDLLDCVTISPSKWFSGPYGFLMGNPVIFKEPIPYRGKLGIFEVPDKIMKIK